MKKTILDVLFATMMVVTILVACSDESSDETLPREIITEVNSIYELGICGDENEGDTVYAKKEDADYYCHSENWIPVSKKDSLSSAKSSSSKASSSSKGKDELSNFTELCKASGGTAKDGTCVCKNVLCDVGAVCNTITGVCGNQSKPSDISSDSKKSSSSAAPTFNDLCKASGGSMKDGACVCKGEVCDGGAVCNTITGVCGNQSKPIEKSSDSKSSSSVASSESKSSSSSASAPTFADLCKASGGTAKDGACVCKETACDEGVLCNIKSKECANKNAIEIECSDSFTNSCSDSPVGIGIVKECVKGVVVNRSCGTVSCNEKGTDCGECLNDVQTCSEDKKFHATVTLCENGKKVTQSCGEKSCDPRDNGCGECTNYEHTCTEDSEDGKGIVYECVAGEPKKAVTICGNKSCRKDKPICGECLNGELRCDNDINNNAVMYRCVDGQWERLHNKFDPLDKDNYKCPVACREGYPVDKMIDQCNTDQCSNCDPCWGEKMEGTPFNPNPCYDEERCKKILAEEDPDYPPFRSFETKQKWKELIPSKKMAAKTVHGYNWNKHELVSSPDERVEDFEFDLTNETRHVTCNIQGTYFGVCHNSLQTCINTSYHTGGYMVVCANGELVDEEKEGDGIACHCEDLGNKNAYGCCYTRSACFKSTNWATDRCAKPSKKDEED